MGIPPSARPRSASSVAARRYSSMSDSSLQHPEPKIIGLDGFRYNGLRQRNPTLKLFRHSTIFFAALTGAFLLVLTGSRLVGQSAAPPSLTILSKDGRRPLPITIVGDQELVFLDDVASVFQLTIREE